MQIYFSKENSNLKVYFHKISICLSIVDADGVNQFNDPKAFGEHSSIGIINLNSIESGRKNVGYANGV